MARILFAGTPDIAVPLLRALSERFEIAGVLTNCDKMQGRSSKPVAPPVKTEALRLGLPVIQFDTLRTEAREAVRSLGADTLVTFAFGRIFGPKFLSLFSQGTFNVHPSRLPEFRGPSPIQSTILSKSRSAFISVQEIGLAMDEGDIFDVMEIPLVGNETTLSLETLIADKSAEFVPSVLEKALGGGLEKKRQSGDASYCTMIDKGMAELDFSEDALTVHSKIRAMYPWPKACAYVNGVQVFITGVYGSFDDVPASSDPGDVKPGTVLGLRKDRGIEVACKDGSVFITTLQLPGKKEMDFRSFVNGNRWILTSVFDDRHQTL